MDCSFVGTSNMNDIFQCLMASTGIPFDAVALLILAAFVIFAAISRLDFDISLAFAITLTWALMVMSDGGSTMLTYLMGLLILGFGLRLLTSILGIFRQ
jgi:hypothetical protein